MFKRERRQCYLGIVICVVLFAIGEVMLNYISRMEKPFLGNTFHIVAGCFLIVLSVLGVFYIIRHLLKLKKQQRRKKSSRVVFLKDQQRQNRNSSGRKE